MAENHTKRVQRLQRQVTEAYVQGKRLRLKRSSTNSTRPQIDAVGDGTATLDLSDFNNILGFDTGQRWVDVEPGVPMDRLAAEAAKNGLVPQVVPEFPGITAGGAVQGGALESSSFKFGQFNDTVLEYELLLANGRAVVATSTNEFSDLYWAIATSYGSIAILTRIRLALTPATKYVELFVVPYASALDCARAALQATKEKANDFIEGVVFSADSAALVTGRLTDSKRRIARFGRNIDAWYYRFVRQLMLKQRGPVTVPLIDYLFRHDKGAFWMGEYLFPIFGLSSNALTRLLFAPFLRTRKLYDGLHALRMEHEFVIQDFYMSERNIQKILDFNEAGPRIYPLWLCPIRATTNPQKLSSHFKVEAVMLLNVGVYGRSKTKTAQQITRALEDLAYRNGDRKMLYADTFQTEKEFWHYYDSGWYATIRAKYAAQNLRDVWRKVYSGDVESKPRVFRGIAKILGQTFRNRNVVWK